MGITKKIQPSHGLENRITEQAGKETQDINNMAKRAFRNRLKGDPGGRTPIFGEVSSLTYHEQMNMVTDIQNRFNHLPPRVRRQFQGNPYLLLKFVEDPKNAKEAVKWGLLIDEEGVFDEPEPKPATNPSAGAQDAPLPPKGSLDEFVSKTADKDGKKP